MPARVPQDVDLEDKLVFGLSPIRFGYLVAGAILGGVTWAQHWPVPLPALAALPLGAAIALALGRWHGHHLDALISDCGVYLLRNYRPELGTDLTASLRIGRAHAGAPIPCRVVNVTAREPGAGITTVAVELAVALALTGEQVRLWDPDQQTNLRLGLMGPGRHEPSGLALLNNYAPPTSRPGILVKALPAGDPIESAATTVMVLTRNSREPPPPGVLPLFNRCDTCPAPHPAVPDDPHVQRAEALRESTVIAFPDAPVSRTFLVLAASLRQIING